MPTIKRHIWLLSRIARSPRRIAVRTVATLAIVGVFAVDPVLAQSTGEAFCGTEMAQTIRNLFTLIQFGGPLLGGLLFLGATVAIPYVRRADLKREIKEVRNQGLVYGVIVAPLGAVIIQFLLTNVVAGGSSCAF